PPQLYPLSLHDALPISPGAGALDEDVNLLHPVFLRLAGRCFGSHLRGVGGGLAGATETYLAGGGPGDHRAGRVGDRDDGVVERRSEEHTSELQARFDLV